MTHPYNIFSRYSCCFFALFLFGIPANSFSTAVIVENANNDSLVSSFCNNLPQNFRTIVIDPGHGGFDEGCSIKNIKEKDIALNIAKSLGYQLKTHYPSLNIIYTRSNDEFVSLQQRIALANDTQADLFISIHCNYVKEDYVSGTETYVLGSSKKSKELVEKEERNSVGSDFIRSIQFKKLENHAYIKSLDIASKIENSFASLKGMKSRGVRHGGFRVLQLTSMPSVLIETGFLSNKKDKKRLISKKGQKDIAKSIFTACVDYFRELREIEMQSKPNDVVKYDAPTVQPIYFTETPEIKKEVKRTYQIQIASFNHLPIIHGDDKWKSLEEVNIVQEGSKYIFYTGDFKDLTSADATKKKLHKKGFDGAFVVIKSEE